MKIVHLTDTYAPVIGGIERQIERLAALQTAAGHDVTVVSGRFGVGPAVTRERGVLVRRPRRPAPSGRALPLHPDDMDADVFHAHVSVLSPGAMRAAAMVHAVGRPLAVTVHSMWPTNPAVGRAVVRLAGLDTDRVAWSAVSAVAADRVAATLSRGREVAVVPNAVDVVWWRGPSTPRPREGVTALLTGRLARRKGVLAFLEVLGEVWPSPLEVVVVGDGPERERIARLAGRRGWSGRVELVGSRSAVGIRRLLHDRADLFVAPSPLESFGIAALEARSAGVPVLARRGTGVADFVRDGVDGWLAGSVDELAAGVVALTASPRQLATLTTNARAVAPSVDQACSLDAVGALYDAATVASPSTRWRAGTLVGAGSG